MQSFDVAPVHVLQRLEHCVHVLPFGKDPSTHVDPLLVVAGTGSHLARVFGSAVKPLAHVRQSPEPSMHCWQPREQASQVALLLRKKPGWQAPHSVPFVAVVQPVEHVHPPLPSQTPLRQLQLLGAVLLLGARQSPVPVGPSSQFVQLAGQGRHEGPKKPVAHVSQA